MMGKSPKSKGAIFKAYSNPISYNSISVSIISPVNPLTSTSNSWPLSLTKISNSYVGTLVDEDNQEYRLGFTTQRLPVKQELLCQAKHHHARGGQQVNKVFWQHPRI